jgi:hypothetical protein
MEEEFPEECPEEEGLNIPYVNIFNQNHKVLAR